MIRYLYIILGLVTLSLGLLGIITPGLPTTPFILLTAFLFAKGSPRLHQKLLDHKLTGRYIKNVNEGFSFRGLAISIGIMWAMICFTNFVVFHDNTTLTYLMLGLGVIGTVAQIIVLRKKKRRQNAALVFNESKGQDIEKENKNLKAS